MADNQSDDPGLTDKAPSTSGEGGESMVSGRDDQGRPVTRPASMPHDERLNRADPSATGSEDDDSPRTEITNG